MALYINAVSTGEMLPRMGKADALIADGAFVIEEPNELQPDLVCVVENPSSDAACYVDIPVQFKICKQPDDRNRIWLIYSHAKKLAK